jgi:hypothetical protein
VGEDGDPARPSRERDFSGDEIELLIEVGRVLASR